MKAAIRDQRVAAAVERAAAPKPKRRVTPKPVSPSKYPRLAHDSDKFGTLLIRPRHVRAARRALSRTPIVHGSANGTAQYGPLVPRVKKAGQKRRAVNRWYRANITAKGVRVVSQAAALGKGTRTPERRAAKAATA